MLLSCDPNPSITICVLDHFTRLIPIKSYPVLGPMRYPAPHPLVMSLNWMTGVPPAPGSPVPPPTVSIEPSLRVRV